MYTKKRVLASVLRVSGSIYKFERNFTNLREIFSSTHLSPSPKKYPVLQTPLKSFDHSLLYNGAVHLSHHLQQLHS